MACQFCTMPRGKHDDDCPYDFARLVPETITLSPEDHEAFVRQLAKPAEPTEALRDLMQRKPAWER